MRTYLVIFPFLFVMHAAASPFGDAIANFSERTVLNTGPYFPEVSWQESGHVRGWIDIVGFREMIQENGTDFVPGNASDFAIVQFDADADVPGIVRELIKSVQVFQNGDTVVAVLNVDLSWKSVICSDKSCWQIPHHEKVQFQDSEKAPKTYPMNQPLNVTVAFYNNSYSPKAVVNTGKNNWTLSEKYSYRDEQIEHFSKKGYVSMNEKGVKYVTYYPADIWKNGNETLFSWMDDSVVINTVNFNLSDLTVTAVSPYGHITEASGYNYSRIDYSPYKTFSPAFFFIFLPIFITYWVVKKSIRRIL